MSQAIETLKALLPVYGPSGREGSIAAKIEELVRPLADEVSRDAMGNLVAVKRGGCRRVMVAAHMDQIGLMVTHIDDDGFLRVCAVGGVRFNWNLFVPVRFENGVTGVVGYETKTVESFEKLKPEHLFIDIGAKDRADAKKKVQIGDVAVFATLINDHGGRISAGAMDDRAACAALIEALRRVAGDKAVKLIREEPNETIVRIVAGWPRNFNATRALSLGFVAEKSMDEIIHAHIEDELGGKIGG